jgi:hypothetical protein
MTPTTTQVSFFSSKHATTNGKIFQPFPFLPGSLSQATDHGVPRRAIARGARADRDVQIGRGQSKDDDAVGVHCPDILLVDYGKNIARCRDMERESASRREAILILHRVSFILFHFCSSEKTYSLRGSKAAQKYLIHLHLLYLLNFHPYPTRHIRQRTRSLHRVRRGKWW